MITTDINGNPLSSAYDTIVKETPRDWSARIYADGTLLDCSIAKLTITKGSCASTESFAVGNVISNLLEAELLELGTGVVKDTDLEVQIGLNTGTDVEWITVGKFYGAEVSKTTDLTKVTAYGYSTSKAGGTFEMPSTLTLGSLATAISDAMDVAITFDSGINTSLAINGTLESTECYAGLQTLARLCGGYATDTNEGNIAIHKYQQTATASADVDMMTSLPAVEEIDFVISGVKVIVREADPEAQPPVTELAYEYPVGGDITLLDVNPNMSQAIFDNVYKDLVGYQFRTGTVNIAVGDPRIEGSDVLEVTDYNDDTYIVPAHMVTHTYDGGVATQVQAVKATTGTDGTINNAPISQRIDEISSVTAIAKAMAESAQASAQSAETSAQQAQTSAQQAQTSAQNALTQAQSATTSAQQASQQAQNASAQALIAQQQAQSATTSANNALTELSIVEDVVDTLNWIATHGVYELTTDTVIIEGKTYYTVIATAVASPTVDDIGTYYEQVSGHYVKTTDTTVVSGKTYYTVSGTPVTNPVVADLGTYYELTITEAVANYINTHLALTDEGLYVTADDSAWKVLVANDGVYIIDDQGATVATYSAGITLGASGDWQVNVANGGIYMIDPDGNVVNRMTASGNIIGYANRTMVDIGSASIRMYAGTTTFFETIVKNSRTDSIIAHKDLVASNITGDVYNNAIVVELTASESGKKFIAPEVSGTATFAMPVVTLTIESLYCDGEEVTPFDLGGNGSSYVLTVVDHTATLTPSVAQISSVIPVTTNKQSDASASVDIFWGQYYAELFVTGTAQIKRQTSPYNATSFYGGIVCGFNNSNYSGDLKINVRVDAVSWIEVPIEAFPSNLSAGVGNKLTGYYDFAFGKGLLLANDNQTAIGKYNDNQTDTAFEIGNGTAVNARSNALAVKWDGNLHIDLAGYQTTDDIDKDIYDALVALGWDSEVTE